MIEVGFKSNYATKKKSRYLYLTATLDAAIWGAELAGGNGRQRIYIVGRTRTIKDDRNLTDKKFPGDPTKSHRFSSSIHSDILERMKQSQRQELVHINATMTAIEKIKHF